MTLRISAFGRLASGELVRRKGRGAAFDVAASHPQHGAKAAGRHAGLPRHSLLRPNTCIWHDVIHDVITGGPLFACSGQPLTMVYFKQIETYQQC